MRPGERQEHPLDRSQIHDRKNMHTPHRKASSLELNPGPSCSEGTLLTTEAQYCPNVGLSMNHTNTNG